MESGNGYVSGRATRNLPEVAEVSSRLADVQIIPVLMHATPGHCNEICTFVRIDIFCRRHGTLVNDGHAGKLKVHCPDICYLGGNY